MLTAVIIGNIELSISVLIVVPPLDINTLKHLYLHILHQADCLAHVEEIKDMAVTWVIKII